MYTVASMASSTLCVQSLGGCGSFYAITIASEKLKGLPILKQHRRIKEVLKDDMSELHGLQVRRSGVVKGQFLKILRFYLQLKVVDPSS